MFRSILTYLLLFSVAIQPFSREMTIMSFELNRDYIIKNLCENRDRPQLHCDGKCYLAKKLKAGQEQQDSATAERVRNLSPMQWFCTDLIGIALLVPVRYQSVNAPISWYVEPVTNALPPGVFQPPRA